MSTIYIYRPHKESRDCAGVAYDEEGNELAFHVSSNYGFFRSDMGLTRAPDGEPVGFGVKKHERYAERYPDGYVLEEVIGGWRDHPVMGKWTDE